MLRLEVLSGSVSTEPGGGEGSEWEWRSDLEVPSGSVGSDLGEEVSERRGWEEMQWGVSHGVAFMSSYLSSSDRFQVHS